MPDKDSLLRIVYVKTMRKDVYHWVHSTIDLNKSSSSDKGVGENHILSNRRLNEPR